MKTVNKAGQSDCNLQQTEKEAEHAEIARKRGAMTFQVLFVGYRAGVAGPLLPIYAKTFEVVRRSKTQ